MPGAVLYREGSDEPLTIASAEAVADGPGWRIRFREVTSRDAADTLRGGVPRDRRPSGGRPRPAARSYWHEVIGVPCAASMARELGVVQDIYRVAENEVYIVERRAIRHVRPAGGPGVHPDLRAAPRRDRRRRRGARPASRPRSDRTDPGSAACAAPDVAATAKARRRGAPEDGRPDEDAPPPAEDAMTLEIDVLTLFPSMVSGPLAESIPGRIQERGLATIRVHDLREFGLGRHRSVDDTPYGGGAGMVMRVEPSSRRSSRCGGRSRLVILLDPGGEVFRHDRAMDLARAITSCWSAPATRASTSGSARSSISSCRSATTW